jgi:hypothetical protein
MSSATGPRSAYQLPPDAAAKGATDDVTYAEEQLRFAEAMGRQDKAAAARRELAEARRRQQERLPPQERLQHLKKELKDAEADLDQREVAVAVTEEEIQRLTDQLKAQRESVEDARARVDRLSRAVETTELQVPPEAQGADPPISAEGLNRALLQAQRILNHLQTDSSEEHKADVIRLLRDLQNKGEEAVQAMEQRRAQEAGDAEMAKNLQEEEERQLREDDPQDEDEWQQAERPRKGKGRSTDNTPSATGMPFLLPHEIGPLATAAPQQERQERQRSPRRQAGTPAQAAPAAAGSLVPAPAAKAASPRGPPNQKGDGSDDDY